jgi:hypothetical protein
MAILGSLILLCFSTLLTFGQRLEEQQNVKMEAFRYALQKAWNKNSSVSYTYRKDGRFFNLNSGFGQGEPSGLSSTANVMWQKGNAGSQGATEDNAFAYYRINDQELEMNRHSKDVIAHDGSHSDVKVPESVYKEQERRLTNYSTTVSKNETPDGTITNTKTSDLQDTNTLKLYTRWDDSESDARYGPGNPRYVAPSYRYPNPAGSSYTQGAKYNPATNRIEYSSTATGTTIHKQRTWTTSY